MLTKLTMTNRRPAVAGAAEGAVARAVGDVAGRGATGSKGWRR
jgi:hypothetical protein